MLINYKALYKTLCVCNYKINIESEYNLIKSLMIFIIFLMNWLIGYIWKLYTKLLISRNRSELLIQERETSSCVCIKLPKATSPDMSAYLRSHRPRRKRRWHRCARVVAYHRGCVVVQVSLPLFSTVICMRSHTINSLGSLIPPYSPLGIFCHRFFFNVYKLYRMSSKLFNKKEQFD